MSSVSVVIPNYNRADLVCETVENMLSQSLRPQEIIVVDDGSTDQSVSMLTKHFGQDIIVIQQKNQGPGAARNAGIERASGEYIQLMDSDDLASRNKLESQLHTAIQTNADFVYGPWLRGRFSGRSIQQEGKILQQAPVPSTRTCLEWFLSGWSFVFQQCLVRKSLIEQAGRFRTDLRCGEDGELFVRMMLSSPKVAFEGDSLTLYRLESDSNKLSEADPASRNQHWANALLAIYEEIAGKVDAQALNGLLAQLWQVAISLQNTSKQDEVLIERCLATVGRHRSLRRMQIDAILGRLRRGIRRRLMQCSWDAPYQTGVVRRDQQRLVEELGYTLG